MISYHYIVELIETDTRFRVLKNPMQNIRSALKVSVLRTLKDVTTPLKADGSDQSNPETWLTMKRMSMCGISKHFPEYVYFVLAPLGFIGAD